MFYLTRQENDISNGVYATKDDDGTTVIQFFVDKDDATTYNVQLSAVGYDLVVSETPDETVEKLSEALGYAYTVVEPGEFVIPRLETLQHVMSDFFQ